MIDVTNPEGRLSFAELVDLLPLDAGGRKIRVATLVRYATKGRRGVKLEAARIGRTWYTTREAANLFFSTQVNYVMQTHGPTSTSIVADEKLRMMGI